MGGRGASSSGRYGGSGGVSPSDILSTNSFVSERHNYDISNDVLDVFKNVNEEYGYVIGDILVAKIKGKSNNTMAYYDGTNIGFNEAYASTKVLNKAYANCVKSGFHPSNGNKSPAEAVASHELGHALTDAVGKKMGGLDIDSASDRIVKEAKKQTGHRGVVQMAKKISTYATHSNAEAVAEAFSDVYCNGKKAHKESQAIVNVINSYLK